MQFKSKYTLFKNNKTNFLPFFLFGLGVVAIMMMLPKERKFKFEYTQNKIWHHKDLDAPFGFSIDKTPKELQYQHDSILRFFSPYYDFNTNISTRAVDTIAQLYVAALDIEQKNNLLGTNEIYEHFGLQSFHKLLQKIYNAGLIDTHFDYEYVIIKKDNSLKRFNKKSTYTLTDAQELIRANLRHSTDSSKQAKLNQIIQDYLTPNVIYNKETSEEYKGQLLSQISTKHGFVSQGTRIITQGETVTVEHKKILDSLKKEIESTQLTFTQTLIIIIGQIIVISIAFFILMLLISYAKPEVLQNRKEVLFIITIVTFFIALAAITLKFESTSIYVIPFLALPIIINNFITLRVAVFTHIITMLIIGFIAPNAFDFIFIQICVGIIVLFAIDSHHERSKLLLSAFVAFVAYSICLLGLLFIKEGSLKEIDWTKFGWFAGSSLLLLSTHLLIFVFEKIFQLTSNLRLFELTNTGKGILRTLQEQAPGTFQHSLQVANLTETALQRIDGNALLGRVAGLYHDIGKISNPHYFIENQIFGQNPHDNLTPLESAKILINHVHYGKELGIKHNLPNQIVAMIYNHHSNSKTKYFLFKQKELYPNVMVDESLFEYPNEKLNCKELGVLSICDAVEAASRSIQIYSKEKISELVERIIDTLIEEKRLKYSKITLEELDIIQEALIEQLINIHHSRIVYPEDKEQYEQPNY